MSQAALFDDMPAPPPGKVVRGGWIRAGAGFAGRWTHPLLPGVAVRHCGHQTANRPYYITGLPIARKFSTLEKAQEAARNPERFIAETAALDAD